MLQLHLVRATFPLRTGRRTVYEIVYDPQKGMVANVDYPTPRTIERTLNVGAMADVLAALKPESLDALIAEVLSLGGRVRSIQSRTFTPFIARHYERGADVWRPEWNPDEEGAALEVLAEMAGAAEGASDRADAGSAEGAGEESAPEDTELLPCRVVVIVDEQGRVRLAHDAVDTLEVLVVRENSVTGEQVLEAHHDVAPEPDVVSELLERHTDGSEAETEETS